jgi:tetratricopeptide (TPR) repeat protein
MLFPWLMFFSEFSSARIQEPFVLYRNYLWMAGLPAVLPLLLSRMRIRDVIIGFTAIALIFVVAARERLGTFASELALWDDAVRKNTNLSLIFVYRGYANRASALLRDDRFEEAMRDIDMAMKLNPRDAHAYVNRAAVYLRKGETAKSLADLDHAINLDSGLAAAHVARCALLIKMAQPSNALESCNAALRIAPEMPAALLNRALLLARASQEREAVTDLDIVLRYEPTHAGALYNRGLLYRNLGQTMESERDLRASCKLGLRHACKMHAEAK